MMSMNTNVLCPPPSALIWPETLHNLHFFHTPQSYLLVCVSTGQSHIETKSVCVYVGNFCRWYEACKYAYILQSEDIFSSGSMVMMKVYIVHTGGPKMFHATFSHEPHSPKT